MSDKQEAKKENRHAATDPQQCKAMARRNQWKLLRTESTGHPILKVDCIFDGEQTSFEDDVYG